MGLFFSFLLFCCAFFFSSFSESETHQLFLLKKKKEIGKPIDFVCVVFSKKLKRSNDSGRCIPPYGHQKANPRCAVFLMAPFRRIMVLACNIPTLLGPKQHFPSAMVGP
ncbi:hypothetical protein OUZ56_004595 [Daphnia magna]|uniref:Secreted protein n=1 Tax=Daphnia magna TaxID=35525 RepID=A0ABQ9YQ89_9CRUS|nr:hypothetical protein OUZ56_004595 [Daphnia magna]